MKKNAYCAFCPQSSGIAKQQTRKNELPIWDHSIQGLAFPIFECVRSIRFPKIISVNPSKNFDTMISVPMIPAFRPIASVI